MNVPFTKHRVNESIFHASAKGYNNSANGVEAVKGGTEVRVEQKNGAPIKPGRRMRMNLSLFAYLRSSLRTATRLLYSST